ncbi:MAG TPA: extracellular solute-binding protein [Candidatus Mediterraneibacter ornithocaccae]|jgi:arabinogalactan oligomer/maltooligosaccharide transport system substrate-binding protein|uniref:extracellular solute-binding protein n=1 Tax=Mediterraneibacter glycyrrhizinilyticus TaxID=342942 RepID=UPI001F910365|nr:extracellular solute-binding protein [Mediterraneibacter glycyrrhizinilyticus]MDN0045195.1 extracellular solute-binding protein [Mediterraneibacter glycyrrhizinilyticus]MDN0060264.1 extracellular solute-binding protein [Mediterraneibacter glycyrrhizinilyticus]HJA19991.1 extracellular solute-binding protein [Candidatus Mediterraneibacter ornithocaccae]
MRRRAVSALTAAVLVTSLAVTGLTGCGSGDGGKESVRLMVWSPQGDQSVDQGQWLQTCCNAFAEEHPEWDITFVYGVADEASSAGQVSQDAEASADVFLYANDNLTTMTDADALVKFGGKYREEIEATNSQTSLDSVTKDGEIYGVPFAINTWFMFYDKSVFSEEDVKNLDTMLEKGVVSFPFTNSWYLPAFYIGNGCTLFGDGTDASAGVDFGGEKAQEVTDYLIDLESNPNFRIDADGSGIAGLRDGSINAMFSGSWDAAAVKEALGDNMGVAALPTYTLNGEDKQMYSYAGTKAVGVNTQSDYMVQAVELAIFLGNEYSQRLHYELENVVPCHTALLEDEEIMTDEVVAAINDTFNRTSILQPNLAEMSNCWTPVENMGKGIRNGSITHENSAEQTEQMNEAMNSDGI